MELSAALRQLSPRNESSGLGIEQPVLAYKNIIDNYLLIAYMFRT